MNIGIYIYDEVEILDFSGPFEVFTTAERIAQNNWNVFLISENESTVKARSNFIVTPHYTIDNHPKIDVLIIPGGVHAPQLSKTNVIEWAERTAKSAQLAASVCTGAFILAETGLLNGLNVTTHWDDIADLRSRYPHLNVLENQRWIKQDKYITAAGISAGIDMSLFLVSELSSLELAEQTARVMEYNWQKKL